MEQFGFGKSMFNSGKVLWWHLLRLRKRSVFYRKLKIPNEDGCPSAREVVATWNDRRMVASIIGGAASSRKTFQEKKNSALETGSHIYDKSFFTQSPSIIKWEKTCSDFVFEMTPNAIGIALNTTSVIGAYKAISCHLGKYIHMPWDKFRIRIYSELFPLNDRSHLPRHVTICSCIPWRLKNIHWTLSSLL